MFVQVHLLQHITNAFAYELRGDGHLCETAEHFAHIAYIDLGSQNIFSSVGIRNADLFVCSQIWKLHCPPYPSRYVSEPKISDLMGLGFDFRLDIGGSCFGLWISQLD